MFIVNLAAMSGRNCTQTLISNFLPKNIVLVIKKQVFSITLHEFIQKMAVLGS
jgi:hypothetical protein